MSEEITVGDGRVSFGDGEGWVGRGGKDRSDMVNRKFILSFVGFSRDRDDDTRLYITHDLLYDYKEEDGKVTYNGKIVPDSRIEECYENRIFARFRVISPLEFYGETLTCRMPIKGFEITDGHNGPIVAEGTHVRFQPDDKMLPGLLNLMGACGMNKNKFVSKQGNELYDHALLVRLAKGLTYPLTAEKMIRDFIEPGLLEKSADGRLVSCSTGKKRAYLGVSTIAAVDQDDQKMFWAKAEAAETVPVDPEPEALPFPGEDEPPESAADIERGRLEAEVRAAVGSGDIDVPGIMNWLTGQGIPYDPNDILKSLSDAGFIQLHAHVCPVKEVVPQL